MNKPSLLAVALAGLAPLGACGGIDAPPEAHSDQAYDTAPAVGSGDLAALVAGDTAFATDLYQQLRGDDTSNLFFSPHSISTALAMTYAGANGDTATQIASTLHFTLPAAQLHPAMDQLALDLASRAQDSTGGKRPFELHQMDALWTQKAFAIEAPFLDTLATSYNAGVYQLDFEGDPDGSRGTINDYVAAETEQRIKDLLPAQSVTPSTRFVLTNAIYFQASWQVPFDPNATSAEAFTTGAGTQVQVQMMHAEEGDYFYGEDTDYQAAELVYNGGDLALDVLLPKDPTGLAAFEASLTSDRLATILGGLQDAPVALSLPKCSFTAGLSLETTLQALGMTVPFVDGAADFSGITTVEPLHIDGILHKGFLSIDEDGTTAAAATAVSGGGGGSVGIPMSVDHAYVIAIRDLKTGAILFLGRVSDPSKS